MGQTTRPIILRMIIVLLIAPVVRVAASQAVSRSSVPETSSARQSPAGSKPRDPIVAITFKDGRLSAFVQNCSLGRVANAISEKAGIPIVLSEEVGSELLSVNFQNLPLDEGLRRIFKTNDTFFFYGIDKDEPSGLKVVWVYPKGKARGMQPVPPEKWASTKDLETMLTDTDPEVRGRAIETLVQRKGDAAREAVLKSLQDDNDQVRTRALYGAIRAGVQISEGVLNNLALNDASPDVRLLALRGLSNSPDARQIAERALNDASEPVRVEAREILTQLDEEANPSPSPPDQQQPN